MTDQSVSAPDTPLVFRGREVLHDAAGRAYVHSGAMNSRVFLPRFDLVPDAEGHSPEAGERDATPAPLPPSTGSGLDGAGSEPEDDAAEALPLDGGGLGGGDGADGAAPAGEITPPLTPPHQGEGDFEDGELAEDAPEDPEDDEDDPAAPPSASRALRHREWNRAKMAVFLRELAACQSVTQAAKSVGMSRQSAYRLRNRMEGTPFALAWEVALEAGLQQLAHAVLDRAVNGMEEPLYYHGEQVGTRRRYDNRLATWLLANPGRLGRQPLAREYAAHGFDRLLERIESDSLDWHEEEPLAGKSPKKRMKAFVERSWYAAEERMRAPRPRSRPQPEPRRR